jgi:uncharacterized protein (TIGR02996 family)
MPGSSSLEALERTLLANPDDTASWLVYADALLARNDPRGEVIVLGEQLRTGPRVQDLEVRYAERCRAARWPRGAPFPRMHYRVRFEQLIAELNANPAITVEAATIDEPNGDLARWKAVAGASWPEGMEELYTELSGVSIGWTVEGTSDVNGAIRLPSLSLWDHDALEGELWFDFTEGDHPFHFIRPIDRFVAEAYAVLYLRPGGKPATVAYHYCGETLIRTGLSYREWLEFLFRSRGVLYWLQLATGPAQQQGDWVEQGIEYVAGLFPDFDPTSMSPKFAQPEIAL